MKKLYYVKMIIMHNLQKMVNVQWSMFNFFYLCGRNITKEL